MKTNVARRRNSVKTLPQNGLVDTVHRITFCQEPKWGTSSHLLVVCLGQQSFMDWPTAATPRAENTKREKELGRGWKA